MKTKEYLKCVKLTMILLLAMIAISVTSCGGNDDNNDVDEPSAYKESDFIGFWIDDEEVTVFGLQDNGELIAYKLKEAGSLFYTETYSGSWKFNKDNNELSFRWDDNFPPSTLTSSGLTNSFKVDAVSSNKLTLKDSYGTLFIVERHNGNLLLGNCDDNRIIGKWKGKDYFGESYTLTFSADGKMVEVWTDGSDTETDSYTFTFKNGKMDFPDYVPIFANSVGNPPFDVKFSSEATPKTMKIYDPGFEKYAITFTRQ